MIPLQKDQELQSRKKETRIETRLTQSVYLMDRISFCRDINSFVRNKLFAGEHQKQKLGAKQLAGFRVRTPG